MAIVDVGPLPLSFHGPRHTLPERDSATDKYTRIGGVFHDDFNTSLSLLYAEDNTTTVISGLRSNREVVDEIMADLQNPPAVA